MHLGARGVVNHHASQLQQLADRVEAVNEWIDLDKIVLARLSADENKSMRGKGKSERENRSRMDVKFKDPKVVSFAGKYEKNEESAPDTSCGVQEAKERARAVRQWRKELERSVCWQRKGYWRVEHAMGKKGSKNMGEGEKGGAGATEDGRKEMGQRNVSGTFSYHHLNFYFNFYFYSSFSFFPIYYLVLFRILEPQRLDSDFDSDSDFGKRGRYSR